MKSLSSCLVAAVLATLTVLPLYSHTAFDWVDVNADDELLFSMTQTVPGSDRYHSLFLTHLEQKGPSYPAYPLTCYPEQLAALDHGRLLQITNRFGTAQYIQREKTTNMPALRWQNVKADVPISYARTGAQSVSPDGLWLCFVRRQYHAEGNLVLQNALTGEERILCERCPFSYTEVPVKWSPDSAFVLYEKDGAVLFISPELAFSQANPDESMRKIGRGTVNSVAWSRDKSLIYLDGDIIYKILESELYIRGLYASFIGYGTIVGRLLLPFDPLQDTVWCDADASQLVIITGNKMLTYCTVSDTSYDFVQVNCQIALTNVSGTPLRVEIFWLSGTQPLLWLEYVRYGSGTRSCAVYRVSTGLPCLMEHDAVLPPQLSPDGDSLAFVDENGLCVYSLREWKKVATFTEQKARSFTWASSNSLYVGGTQSVQLWTVSDVKGSVGTRFLFLSAIDDAFWNGAQIIAEMDGTQYLYDVVGNCWAVGTEGTYGTPHHHEKNERYRVYLDAAKNRNFENAIFVRPLEDEAFSYPLHAQTQDVLPEPKQVALIFDATNNAEFLPKILAVLEEFGMTGTFFINGEFIRRYPRETIQIANSGNVCASSFHITIDLLTTQYDLDDSFIKRGLARNEDEFFSVTGKELSLLWHAPYYRADTTVITAGQEAGYVYVDAFARYFGERVFDYLPSENLIDTYISLLYDGIIIPVSVAKTNDIRRDSLAQNLDLFLAAICDSGYQIVSVQSLLDPSSSAD